MSNQFKIVISVFTAFIYFAFSCGYVVLCGKNTELTAAVKKKQIILFSSHTNKVTAVHQQRKPLVPFSNKTISRPRVIFNDKSSLLLGLLQASVLFFVGFFLQ